MNEQKIEELGKAISKLSEEEQEQIAAAGRISNVQCEKINKLAIVDKGELGKRAIISYGVAIPGIVRDDTKKINWEDTMRKGNADTSETISEQ